MFPFATTYTYLSCPSFSSAINLVADQFNEFNTVVLTDGYCDSLDLSKIKGKVLMISIGVKIPIARSNGKVKQIVVDIEK